jgi:flavin-dependent dehydrogenase
MNSATSVCAAADEWDAVIAGAGPAGVVAAARLARAGRRVLLVDREGTGGKIGEALPGAAVRLLRALDLPAPKAEGPHAPIAGTLSAWGSSKFIATDTLRDPYGAAWRLDRRRFDADLRAAALVAGATARPALLREAVRDGDGWRLHFDDGGQARARWIVDATGRRARLARKLGARRQRDSRLIALYRIGTANAGFRESRTFIEAAADGWWYAARLPSGAVIAGLHTDANEAARIKAEPHAWTTALAATCQLGPLLAAVQFAQPLPAADAGGARLSACHGDGWIACGDAALSFDPISGQGIFAALHSAMDAAAAVDAALDGERALLDAYGSRMTEVWSIYRSRHAAVYASEQRWPDRPVWSRLRHERAA